MREPLTDLKNMIGMDSVKKSIIRQIVYFLQGIELGLSRQKLERI